MLVFMDGRTTTDQYLDDIRDQYEHGPIDSVHKRLASWRATADSAIFLYLVLAELRSLNARLAADSAPHSPNDDSTPRGKAAPCRG